MRSLLPFALVAAALIVAGCGQSSCPTESPAKIQAVGSSCTAKPGDTVSVPVRLCPTCNQTGATCHVDTSQASSGYIQLDPTVEACDSVTSCGTPTPTCDANPLTCSFTAPAQGHYTIIVVDATGQEFQGTLDVTTGVSPSCSTI